MVRQLTFAMTDLALHSTSFEPAPGAAAEMYRQVALRTTPTSPLPEDRFLNGFAHIFAGGCKRGAVGTSSPNHLTSCLLHSLILTRYRVRPAPPDAAGYFSYKWAEVLSADGFAAFEEGGLDNASTVEGLGRLYADTVMGLGGSKPAAEVFELFRGRPPKARALLRHDGLL